MAGIRAIAQVAAPLVEEGAYAEIEMNPVFARADGLWIADAVLYEAREGTS